LGRDSSVGIATRYGLNGPGIESRWGEEIFRTRPDRSWGQPSLMYNGYRVFPGGKEAWGDVNRPPPSSATIEERVPLYLYTPSGPSCPVPGLTFKNRASYIQDGRTATLQMLHFIYFSSTNISTEYFKHAAHFPFFSSKCRLFYNATFFGSCIIHILYTGCAKI